MYTVTTYFADDGTEFEDKQSCLDYEMTTQLSDNVLMYDDCWEPIIIDKNAYDVPTACEHCHYVMFTNEETIQEDKNKFKALMEYVGYSAFASISDLYSKDFMYYIDVNAGDDFFTSVEEDYRQWAELNAMFNAKLVEKGDINNDNN